MECLKNLRYTLEQIEVKEKRIGDLIKDMHVHKLFGNKDLMNKCARFVFMHRESLENLYDKRSDLVKSLKG